MDMIPKKIHYCWFGPKPYPKLVEKCIVTWQQHLPDYKFCLWNEQNSPMEHPFVQAAYEAKKYAFVSDYVRFWALYNHGGIYLDTDMFALRSFDDLLENESFWGWETEQNTYISCGIIGCIKEHLFIREIMYFYGQLEYKEDNKANLIVSRIVMDIYERYSAKNQLKIFPYDYFYPFLYQDREKNIASFLDYATENTYAIHLWNLSWVSKYAKLRERFFTFIKLLKQKWQ
jgi:hypothetical protein